MLNNASKFALGVTVLAAFAAVGSRMADGDRAGALILLGLAIAAAVIAFGISRSVGADLAPFHAPDAATASTPIDPADVGEASYGPLAVAAGATVALAGGALGPYWVLFGGILAAIGSGLWAFDTFRTPGAITARDAANVDTRFLGPLALPVLSFLTAITIAYCFSRVLLAVNETASWVVAFIVAASMLAILALVAAKAPQRKVAAGLAGVGVVVTLAVGGTFAGIGEREFHNHGHELPTVEITAKDIAFDRKIIALPANTKSEIIFTNLDLGTFHNVAIYTTDQPGRPEYNGRPSAKGVQKYEFTTPAEGTYRYVCDFHPAMTGELRVTAAPAEKENEH